MAPTTSEPIRTCVGCRQRRPASQLIRVRRRDGVLITDVTVGGRGAWLCRATLARCVEHARVSRAFDRALRAQVPTEAVVHFLEQMSAGSDGGRLGNRR